MCNNLGQHYFSRTPTLQNLSLQKFCADYWLNSRCLCCSNASPIFTTGLLTAPKTWATGVQRYASTRTSLCPIAGQAHLSTSADPEYHTQNAPSKNTRHRKLLQPRSKLIASLADILEPDISQKWSDQNRQMEHSTITGVQNRDKQPNAPSNSLSQLRVTLHRQNKGVRYTKGDGLRPQSTKSVQQWPIQFLARNNHKSWPETNPCFTRLRRRNKQYPSIAKKRVKTRRQTNIK